MSQEVELKLVLLDPDMHMEIVDHPSIYQFCQEDPLTYDVVNTYFDTPDYLLASKRLAVRIRESRGEILQTIKLDQQVEQGLHQRFEETAVLEKPYLDLRLIQDPTVKKLLGDIAFSSHLSPIFTTNFARTEWCLSYSDTVEVEMVMDMGAVEAGGQAHPIHEIELELKKGDAPYLLYEIAADLARTLPIALEPHSKAWWGYKCHQAAQDAKAVAAQPYEPLTPEFLLQQSMLLRQQLAIQADR